MKLEILKYISRFYRYRLSNELIYHRERFGKLAFRALAIHQPFVDLI